jgi:6-pyruvoyltetrahydropterin/6-carboxytetrahydropterin synthase
MRNHSLLITRELEFSAAHRLYLEEYSEAENYEVFGKCANPYGHGHNYTLQVTICGTPDPKNGMIVHFTRLNRILDEVVVTPLDHRHLNHDVAFLEGVLPTSENLIRILWDRIAAAFEGAPFSLHQLRLASSPRNWVDYRGPSDV